MRDPRPVPLPDATARRQAADDFEHNFVVLAGAGTGKTSLLVERVLSAVGRGIVEIREIAALTFTEKAAGEMRQRVADGLEHLRARAREEIDAGVGLEADRALQRLTTEHRIDRWVVASRAVAALEQLDQATIETIHRFCSGLLRAKPFEAGVDPDFAVDAGQQAERLRRSIWDSFVVRELGPAAERPELWRRLLRRLPLDEVRQAAQALTNFAIPTELLNPDSLPSAESLFADEIRESSESIDSLLARQSGMTRTALTFFEAMRRCLRTFADDGLAAFQQRIDADPEFADRVEHRPPQPNTRLAGVSADEMRELVKRTCRLVRQLRKVDEATLVLGIEAALPYVQEFREAFLRGGFVSFDGLLVLARDLLLHHPRVRRQCKRRFRMLLVDEFQDTDPLQYEIVLLLAEDPQGEATDPYAAALTPGRLFAVGDAKQSIYRFRGADYRAYRRAVDRVVECGGIELTLQANFRSLPGVIEPVNRLFAPDARGCWIASAHQPDYVPITAVRQAPDAEPKAEIWTVTLEAGVTASERRDAEGERIADAILDLVDRKACRYREIALLFRAFTEISHYLRPLRERQIPFVVDGGRDFLQRPEVVQLMAALRALSRPADQAALLAFLRSPAGGVSDVELFEFADRGGRWDWRQPIDAGAFPRMAACFSRLRELRRETRNLPADTVIRRVLERTLLLPLGAAAFEGAQRVANLRKLAAAAGELARDGRLALDEVVEALQEGRLTEITSDAPLADAAEDAILITSIHRMKGLESSWVFLPDFARGEARGARDETVAQALVLPDGSRGLALGVQSCCNAAAVLRQLENERHSVAEEVRVLYVALTRARDRLVVVAGPSRSKAPWIEALRPWGYDGTEPPEDGARLCAGQVLHRRVEQCRTTRQREARPPRDVEQARRRYESAIARLEQARTEPPFVAPSGLVAAAGAAAPDRRIGDGNRSPGRATGIAIHRLLESWNDESPQATLEHLRRLCAGIVDELGVAPEQLASDAEQILATFLDSTLAERLRSVEILGRELPVLARQPRERTLRGSIDLLYREPDGAIVVADFKTDRAVGPEELRERYGPQLRAYGEAVRDALGLDRPPRMELWSLRTGTIVPVDP